MSQFKKTLIKYSVKVMLTVQAFLFRYKFLNFLGYALNHLLAWSRIIAKNIQKTDSPGKLGMKWQQAFPSTKHVPVTKIDARTVYAEIHTPCPLRGSGDVEACYKMMSFDRTIANAAGGQFIVLQSQAEEGVHKCKVAMRLKGQDVSDLTPAHLKES